MSKTVLEPKACHFIRCDSRNSRTFRGGHIWGNLGVGSKREFQPVKDLLKLEARINLHISCYATAHYSGTATLYELEQMICAAEKVSKFDDLEMGPILKYPQVQRTFRPAATLTQTPQVTTEDICEAAWQTRRARCNTTPGEARGAIRPEEVLQTLMDMKEATSPDELCITMPHNFHSIIRMVSKARKQYNRAVMAYSTQLDKQLEAALKLEQQRLDTEHAEGLGAWKALLLETRGAAAATSSAATPQGLSELPGAPGPPDAVLGGQAMALSAAAGLEAAGAATDDQLLALQDMATTTFLQGGGGGGVAGPTQGSANQSGALEPWSYHRRLGGAEVLQAAAEPGFSSSSTLETTQPAPTRSLQRPGGSTTPPAGRQDEGGQQADALDELNAALAALNAPWS